MNWTGYWTKNRLWRRLGSRLLGAVKYNRMPNILGPVLEVGCGRSTGGKYRKNHIRVDLERTVRPDIVADVHSLPFRDKSIVLAYSFGLLEHLDSPQKALEEMRRVGRRVYFSIPYRGSLIEALHELYQWWGMEWIFPPETYYGPEEAETWGCRRIQRVAWCEDLYVCC